MLRTANISTFIIFSFLLGSCGQTSTNISDKKSAEQAHTKEIYNEMGMLLTIYYAEVHPVDSKHRYLVATKNGQHFEAWIDSKTDSYVFGFSVFKALPIADTLMWIEKLSLIEPMLSTEQIHELKSTLDKKRFKMNQKKDSNSFHIPFSKGEIALFHHIREKRMEIAFPR